MATQTQPEPTDPYGSVSDSDLLDDAHRNTFCDALTNLLSIELAEFTYAQILDGLPTRASYRDFTPRSPDHPVEALNHEQLCEGVLDKTREFRSNFDPTVMKFRQSLLSAFQKTTHCTKEFQMRLVVLLAIAFHDIAVHLYQLDAGLHKHQEYVAWRDEPRVESRFLFPPGRCAFSHRRYQNTAQYPNGLADCAGYWAEAKIFGGVVLFDRGVSRTECNHVYFHGSRLYDSPMTLYPATAEQWEALMDFLLAPVHSNKAPCPLPIEATSANRPRWSAKDCAARFHIYRDPWEQTPPAPPSYPMLGTSCGTGRAVQSQYDWPEVVDQQTLTLQCHYLLPNGPQPPPDLQEKVVAAWTRLRDPTLISPSSPLWGRYGDAWTSSPWWELYGLSARVPF